MGHLQVLLALLGIYLQVVEVVGGRDAPLLQTLLGHLVVVRRCDVADVAAARMQHDPHTTGLIVHNLLWQ